MRKLLLLEIRKNGVIYFLYGFFSFFMFLIIAGNPSILGHRMIPFIGLDNLQLILLINSIFLIISHLTSLLTEKWPLYLTFHYSKIQLISCKHLIHPIIFLVNYLVLFNIGSEYYYNNPMSYQTDHFFAWYKLSGQLYLLGFLPLLLITIVTLLKKNQHMISFNKKGFIYLYVLFIYIMNVVLVYGLYYSSWYELFGAFIGILYLINIFVLFYILLRLFERFES